MNPDPEPQPDQPYVFDLDAGRVALDFANTRSSSGEHLGSYIDLLGFALQSQLITPEEAERLQHAARRNPSTARAVLDRARRLRDAVRGVFSAVAAGEEAPAEHLAGVNEEIGVALAHAQVVAPDYVWGWRDRDLLDAPLWPVSRSAAELLTSETERPLVRECGADDCKWLFLDTSRNRSRQWCSMRSCGNREKARRHYQRKRAQKSGSEQPTDSSTSSG